MSTPTDTATGDSTGADDGPSNVVTVAYDDLPQADGVAFGPSSWKQVTQEEVNTFADVTGDHNPVHVDPEFAATTAYGGTIAHGFLTLSQIVPLVDEVFTVKDFGLGINYGLNRVRFPSAVPVGSRVRARGEIADLTEIPGGYQFVQKITVEREGSDKPAAAIELVVRYYK